MAKEAKPNGLSQVDPQMNRPDSSNETHVLYASASCGFYAAENYTNKEDYEKAISFLKEWHTSVCEKNAHGETCELEFS